MYKAVFLENLLLQVTKEALFRVVGSSSRCALLYFTFLFREKQKKTPNRSRLQRILSGLFVDSPG